MTGLFSMRYNRPKHEFLSKTIEKGDDGMNAVGSVRKIKEATLALSKKTRCEKISVSMVIAKAQIARSTFYKQFPGMAEVWHSFSHDFIHSLAQQRDELYVAPARIITEPKQSHVAMLASQNPSALADYFSGFFLRHQHLLKCLVKENLDPLFLKKWKEFTCSIFVEILQHRNCSRQESFEIAEILSAGLVGRGKDAIFSKDASPLYGHYMTAYKILFSLS